MVPPVLRSFIGFFAKRPRPMETSARCSPTPSQSAEATGQHGRHQMRRCRQGFVLVEQAGMQLAKACSSPTGRRHRTLPAMTGGFRNWRARTGLKERRRHGLARESYPEPLALVGVFKLPGFNVLGVPIDDSEAVWLKTPGAEYRASAPAYWIRDVQPASHLLWGRKRFHNGPGQPRVNLQYFFGSRSYATST